MSLTDLIAEGAPFSRSWVLARVQWAAANRGGQKRAKTRLPVLGVTIAFRPIPPSLPPSSLSSLDQVQGLTMAAFRLAAEAKLAVVPEMRVRA